MPARRIDSLAPDRAGAGEAAERAQLVVVIPYVELTPELGRLGERPHRGRATGTHFGDARRAAASSPQLPFDHPLYILYSSGTTGVPKCIVHGAGGTLLQHQKEHLLHTDIEARRPAVLLHHLRLDDVELAGQRARHRRDARALRRQPVPSRMPECSGECAAGGAIDASSAPAPNIIAALQKSGFVPVDRVDLDARCGRVLSTGSPLLPEGFDFVYRAIKPDLHLASISGGTDIVSCFALGCPTLPGVTAARSSAAASAWRSNLRRDRHADPRRTRRAGVHGAFSVHAGRLLERPGRRATARPTSNASPASGTTATSPH